MGKATRWLKGLLGMRKEKEKDHAVHAEHSNSVYGDKKEKKRWSFGKSAKDAAVLSQIPMNINPRNINIPVSSDAAWFRSYMSESEKEQNKHAIAVAAATTAAADAALAAAQAAVAVVRLTSNGRGTLFGGGKERWAAIKVQTVFRGYLARKALRALKGLVRLQALVRGYLVRKRAAATLHSMQALIRAQTAIRSQRIRRALNKFEHKCQPESRPRRSIERVDDSRSEIHSKRLSASLELHAYEDSPKIVEIDTYKPRSRLRRINVAALSECGDELPYQAISSSSPLPCIIQGRPCQNVNDFEWCFTGDECRFSTAQSTPRFAHSARSNAPATPAKSVCGDSYFRPYSNFPNYMSHTQSFEAKLRSLSAPKQRPEPGGKKRLSLNEIMASRNSISGVRMHRSSSKVQDSLNFLTT